MEPNFTERKNVPCRNCELERLKEQMKDVWYLVTHPDTPAGMLDDLSHRLPVALLERLAEHPNVEPTTLERLSYHPSPEVRSAVAENLNTPTHVIFALTHDSNPDVRYAIAENHSSPTEALELLAEDENPYVAYRAHMTLLRIGPQRQAQQLAFPQVSDRRKSYAG